MTSNNILYDQLNPLLMNLINIITGYATASPSANILTMIMDGTISQYLDETTMNVQPVLINSIREMQENFLQMLRRQQAIEDEAVPILQSQ